MSNKKTIRQADDFLEKIHELVLDKLEDDFQMK